MNALREKGAIFVEDPETVPEGSLLIFSAHGVSPAVRSAAERNGLQVIDATCPLVTKVHKEAVRLAKQGYDIVLIGHAGHVEVQGTMGHAPDRMHLVESVEDAEALEVGNPSMLGCVTQTTLSVDDTREIMETLRRRFPEILLPRRDDICYATQNRQNAVKKMTTKSDVVIVVGAPASSNSNRLVELAAKQGARSYLVQDASDIDPHWLTNTRCVGITAGASTPEVLVEEVVGRLTALGASNVVRQPAVDEGMVFPLPTSLR